MSRLINTFKDMLRANNYTKKDIYVFGLVVCPVVGYGVGMVINYNHEAYKYNNAIEKILVGVKGGLMGIAGGMLFGCLWPAACIPAALVGVEYVYGKLTNKKTSDNDN